MRVYCSSENNPVLRTFLSPLESLQLSLLKHRVWSTAVLDSASSLLPFIISVTELCHTTHGHQ